MELLEKEHAALNSVVRSDGKVLDYDVIAADFVKVENTSKGKIKRGKAAEFFAGRAVEECEKICDGFIVKGANDEAEGFA